MTQINQKEKNKMGSETEKKIQNEYPQYKLKIVPNAKGYDIILIRYEIKIEVKRRKGSPWVDITKSQWNISDIISVCDEENEEFHMLTEDFRKIVKSEKFERCEILTFEGSSKYARIPKSLFRKLPQTTKDLSNLIEPMIKERHPRT